MVARVSAVLAASVATIDLHCIRFVGRSFLDVKYPAAFRVRLGWLLARVAGQVALFVPIVFRIIEDSHERQDNYKAPRSHASFKSSIW
jgi:hypothetical protein